MNSFKPLVWILSFLLLLSAVSAVNSYNTNGAFTVVVDETTKTVFNDDINTFFLFTLTNNEEEQDFLVVLDQQTGWDIDIEERSFSLAEGESKQIQIDFEANSNFDYTPTVVSPDAIVISQKDEYTGLSKFPLSIVGDEENVSLQFSIFITKREIVPINFDPQLATQGVSPTQPLQFTIRAENIVDSTPVFITTRLGDVILSEQESVFTADDTYKIFSTDIPSTTVPGAYDAKIIVRFDQQGNSAQEWFDSQTIQVVSYENVIAASKESSNFFSTTYKINMLNEGNVESLFTKEVAVNGFNKIFLTANTKYEYKNGNVVFSKTLAQGESFELCYRFNYLPLYLLLLVIVIVLVYLYHRKASNPLDVETKIYEIKKVLHEGVKSMKIRIGFENIKVEEIETLKLTFRMPSYLQVKEDSFLLSPPKKVLKGRDEYKLMWEFKHFSKNDSRILGFSLVNKRGVLGDIKIPSLEVEVKSKGKVKKYYTSFPLIKG